MPLTGTLRVLGVYLGRWFTLDEHFTLLTHRAQVRLGVLARLARTERGLEVGVLRMTGWWAYSGLA